MLIIPAIDIKDGCVVRFVQGRLNKKVYSKDPVKTARHWVSQGATFIHVVDLDGAVSGVPKNIDTVKKIAETVEVPIQFGGGLRSIVAVKKILDAGISRVVLGTKAVKDRVFLQKAYKQFKNKIIISIDAKASSLLTEGWQKAFKETDIFSFAKKLKELGFKEIIYTDTLKDGTLKGPNIKDIKRLLKESSLKIIASGGISSLDDLWRLKLLEKDGLIGVIIGKALYEGKFTLAEALKLS